MSPDLIILATLAIAGAIGSIVIVVRDGYRRVPTR
jgi:hypothetical protein